MLLRGYDDELEVKVFKVNINISEDYMYFSSKSPTMSITVSSTQHIQHLVCRMSFYQV